MINKLITKNLYWHLYAFSVSLVLAIFVLCLIYGFTNLNHFVFQNTSISSLNPRYSKFHDPRQGSYYILKNSLENNEIVLFGTSELGSNNTSFTSFNFFPQILGIQLRAFGRAGYQSKAILTELLTTITEKTILNGRVVILISPTWFLSGKQMDDQLWKKEIATPLNLSRIRNNSLINNSIKVKILDKSSINWLDNFTDNLLIKYFDKNFSIVKSNLVLKKTSMYRFQEKAHEIDKKLSTNQYNITDEYFLKTIKPILHTEKFPFQIQTIDSNQPQNELNDFKDLLASLQEFKNPPIFIILPLNRKIFSNLDKLNPTIELIKKNLNEAKYPFLDLWSMPQDIGLLADSVHLGAYGWYLVDEFILKNYSSE